MNIQQFLAELKIYADTGSAVESLRVALLLGSAPAASEALEAAREQLERNQERGQFSSEEHQNRLAGLLDFLKIIDPPG